MSEDASEFMQALSKDGEAIGLIPGGSLSDVLQVWGTMDGGDGVLRVRLPYRPGRKDRQLASVLLQALERPLLARSISTAKAWEEAADLCREYGYRLVVIENADLLDRDSLAYIIRKSLPMVVLVGGEQLARKISQNAACSGRILRWRATSQDAA